MCCDTCSGVHVRSGRLTLKKASVETRSNGPGEFIEANVSTLANGGDSRNTGHSCEGSPTMCFCSINVRNPLKLLLNASSHCSGVGWLEASEDSTSSVVLL